jgi:sugar phosphate isomerase/epimerase
MERAADLSRRALLLTAAGAALGAQPGNEFFALDTAMVRNLGKDFVQESDVELLKSLGYGGTALVVPRPESWRHLTGNVLPWLEKRRLKHYAVYTTAQISEHAYTLDPELANHWRVLKQWKTIVWLPVASNSFKPSDPAGDDLAVAAVREAADRAAEHGLRISVYPHVRNLVERVGDAVRIVRKVDRPNAGVTFNLCHWLRVEGADHLDRTLEEAGPYLSVVTINGADRDGKEWIQPLDSGDFDVAMLLRKLRKLGYRGPIGLQGYNVAVRYNIEPAENLRRSMDAWRALATS